MVVQNMNLETQHICIVHDKSKVQNFCMDMEVVNPVPDLGRKFEALYKDQMRSWVCRQKYFWVWSNPRKARGDQ